MDAAKGKTQRQEGIELLRIVATLLIISIHFLDKGEVLEKIFATGMSVPDHLAYIIEAFAIPSLNAYILISGYFLSLSKFKKERLISVWAQVFFYSIVVATVCLIAFPVLREACDGESIIKIIFPILNGHWWFASTYVTLFMLLPFLNTGINSIEKKEYKLILTIMIILFSVSKSVIPIPFRFDQGGFDILWFIIVYLIGGYLRRFGQSLLERRGVGILLYLIGSLGMYFDIFLCTLLYEKSGIMLVNGTTAYTFNNIFCIAASLGLFIIFYNIKINSDSIKKVIFKLAGTTFSVYLIHEHTLIKYQWPKLFGAAKSAHSFSFIPRMLIAAIVVFSVTSLIDMARQKLFKIVSRRFSKK